MADVDELTRIAVELYVVPPSAFTAERNARAAAITDDRGLASAVRDLRKPAPAAWLLNLLVRSEPHAIGEALEFGARVREAQQTFDRATVTALGEQRREIVAAIRRLAADAAGTAGVAVASTVLDAVEATIEAGMADPAAAAAIRTGRLTRALEAVGFDPVDLADAVALPRDGSSGVRSAARGHLHAVVDPDAELDRARHDAEETLARAESELVRLTADSATAGERDTELSRRRTELEERIADLASRLAEAKRDLGALERESRQLDGERAAADRALARARTAVERARARLTELRG